MSGPFQPSTFAAQELPSVATPDAAAAVADQAGRHRLPTDLASG